MSAVPAGRGRWRVTIHDRVFGNWASPVPAWQQTILVEVDDARGRKLDKTWDGAAVFAFTVDGRSAAGALIQELQHDVYVWRWDEARGRDVCMFRGPITQAEDQLTTERHAVTFTAHDYLAMLERSIYTSNATYTNVDQDAMVNSIVALAGNQTTDLGTSLHPACYLPLYSAPVTPAGATRGASGQLRTRAAFGNATLLETLDAASKVQNGFDYDVLPAPEAAAAGLPSVPAGVDALRVFYPAQGIARTDIAFVYGANVAGLTRAVNSADYANYVRELGNSGTGGTQLARDAWNAEATSATPTVGLWMLGNNRADVSTAAGLTEHANGDLALTALLDPAYTLTLTAGAYVYGVPNIGDTVQTVVQSGRLDVNTALRVLGLAYVIGDDGNEDVAVTVGRPQPNLRKAFRKINNDVSALTRR